ncbi:MAG: type II and III secretion system protein family protein [Rickettsiales bacterium]|nr:type II and III secretion system protein family protein [Rickettsiales bacterium]
MKTKFLLVFALVVAWTGAAIAESFIVPLNRSRIVSTGPEIAEAMVANPEIADIHVHGPNRLSIVGVSRGQTTVRLIDKARNEIKTIEVTVSYDLPAIRKALREFLPYESIGVDLVNTNLALTGEVSGAASVDKALEIISQFVDGDSPATEKRSEIVNLMRVSSGQQVMLRVRVGEIRRNAMKKLGISLQGANSGGSFSGVAASGGGIPGVTANSGVDFGTFVPGAGSFSFLGGVLNKGGLTLGASLDALETDGLLKILAEPNLVALSGEQAEFLAGGEFPIPVASGSDGNISIDYKPFGVSVSFIPYVLSENRIRLTVLPEVSELSGTDGVTTGGVSVPALTTRRAKTTVELAPGESFMIAGLIRNDVATSLRQLPGINEIPILSALLRSTEFERNETELVIAVTPYLVDPQKSDEVRFPTDRYRAPSNMEMFFYGALSAMGPNGKERRLSQAPSLEGPIGFMVE